MAPLEPPDTWYLSGALGWLGLRNAAEAEAELAQISPSQSQHPDVLEVRWLVCAELEKWAEGLQVARWLIHAAPDRPSGWLHQAYALRRAPGGSVQQAWDALLPVVQKFPREPIVPYNLACYACQLGRLGPARIWLKRALAMTDKDEMKRQALADRDLEPLWGEIPGF
ncbi:MAG TPA: tetratricopeptide repeat protein [Verrucomicrobiae bacterium]